MEREHRMDIWSLMMTSLVINPESACCEEMIFQKYLDGMNITQLARYLNEQKIMSPGQYKREVLKTGVKKTTENISGIQ